MAKFLVDISSPDGPVVKKEIEQALTWLMNHDGVAWRGIFKVTDFGKLDRYPKIQMLQLHGFARAQRATVNIFDDVIHEGPGGVTITKKEFKKVRKAMGLCVHKKKSSKKLKS